MSIEFDIDRELKNINESISEEILDFYEENYLYSGAYIGMFKFKQYTPLIIKLNQIRLESESYDEKARLIGDYLKVYYAIRLKYRKILRNLESGELNILYNMKAEKETGYLQNLIKKLYRYDHQKTFDENLKLFTVAKIRARIYETNNEIYKLKYFPHEYINTFYNFIGPYKPTKYDKDIIFYKDVFIAHKEQHHFSVFYNENSLEETKSAILNILAYFNGGPYFYFTHNYSFNRKLFDLYEQFDLLDMIRLRKSNYFDSNREEPFYLESPILKYKSGHNFIELKPVQHELMFELYHASLKQFEALPRCVFLYRVFEYGANNYYIPTYRPQNYKPQDALDDIFNRLMSHKYVPLYYLDYGSYLSIDGKEIISKRKAQYRNFTIKLKKEAKKIIHEWSIHSYLSGKTIGQILYETGRNASAHGGGGRLTARYDYSNNYIHINNVNIFLELIARYLIEIMNPEVMNMIERRKIHYIKYNGYEKKFGIEEE